MSGRPAFVSCAVLVFTAATARNGGMGGQWVTLQARIAWLLADAGRHEETVRGHRRHGRIVVRQAPFELADIWALRVRLQMEGRVRGLAMFNLGIDIKLRGRDLVAPRVRDASHGDQVATHAIVMQHGTQRPVRLETTQAARDALQAWIRRAGLKPEDFPFPSRLHGSPHLGTRQ